MEAIGYARVSTPGQAKEGVSLDAQRERIVVWCAANDYRLVDLYADAGMGGGRLDNRPALQAALAHACKRRAALVTHSLSRLARSTKDAIKISERLARAGADLVSLSEHIDTTTAAGKLVFRMLAVLAEFERDIIAERTKAAMQYKRAKHEYTGGAAPYGWRVSADGVVLTPHTDEQTIIRRARTLRAAGMSLRVIGRRLIDEALPPRSGGRWHPKTIAGLLKATGAGSR